MDLREQFNVAREQMDRERASAHTSERLADLRREGSVKAAEFERLASALDEEADEVEAQYRRMERAAATLRGARKEAADLLSLLGGVLEDLVDLEETADEAEAKAQLGGTAGGETPTPTLDAGRAAEDDASARAFEAARAAAIASAASLLQRRRRRGSIATPPPIASTSWRSHGGRGRRAGDAHGARWTRRRGRGSFWNARGRRGGERDARVVRIRKRSGRRKASSRRKRFR